MKRRFSAWIIALVMFSIMIADTGLTQSIVFTKRDELRPTGPLLWPSVTDIKMANFGGDSNPDVVYVVSDEIGICLNENGKLLDPLILQKNFGYVMRLAVADWNSDGLIDIGFIYPGEPGYSNGTVNLLINEGDYEFTHRVIDSNYMGVNSIVAADINGNGAMDIVVSSSVQIGFGWFPLSWYENDGTGQFTKHHIDSISQGSSDIAVGDINQDGNPDVIYGGKYGFDLFWYENDGTGVFTKHPIEIPHDYIDWVSVYDMDDNGYPDILLAVRNPKELIILLNEDGGTTFTRVVVCNSEQNYRRPYVVDLDGDGDPDIINAVRPLEYDVIWYENDGDLNFTLHVIDHDFTQVGVYCALDVTGNGRPDVVGGNVRGGLAWWENQPHVGIDLTMPAHQFTAGSPCNLTASIYNHCSDYSGQLPMFVALEAGGNFWFYPSWTGELQYTMVNVTPGSTNMHLLDPFTWPSGTGSASGIHFYGLFTKPDFSALMGDINYWEFGWE